MEGLNKIFTLIPVSAPTVFSICFSQLNVSFSSNFLNLKQIIRKLLCLHTLTLRCQILQFFLRINATDCAREASLASTHLSAPTW